MYDISWNICSVLHAICSMSVHDVRGRHGAHLQVGKQINLFIKRPPSRMKRGVTHDLYSAG